VTKEQLFIQLIEQLSAEDLFHGHAVIDAEDEAMMVAMSIFNQDVEEILSSGDQEVSQVDIDSSRVYIQERLTTLKPMAYILGSVNFCGLQFKSDERALVPRSPIAELIQNGFLPWVDTNKVNTVLDLCTGSGCIGISIQKHYQHIEVDISDISHKALTLAQENKKALLANVNIIQSDLFTNIKQKYDLIVTNPPYVSDLEYLDLPEEYKHEPKLGLVTEFDGLRIPVEIMLKAPAYLNDNGYLFLEVGYSDEALDKAFPQISIEWITFLNGGQGVCVFSKKTLVECEQIFKSFLEK
jgi:ribosomal protein L3 glutamine methyltransferase